MCFHQVKIQVQKTPSFMHKISKSSKDDFYYFKNDGGIVSVVVANWSEQPIVKLLSHLGTELQQPLGGHAQTKKSNRPG